MHVTAARAIDAHTLGKMIRQQFDHFVDDVPRLANPADWPTFRRRLHEALVAAWGLDGTRSDLDPRKEARRRTARLRGAYEMIDRARAQVDPATGWAEFREALWSQRDMLLDR